MGEHWTIRARGGRARPRTGGGTTIERTYRTDYWDDVAARETFIAWLRGMHGLDLSSWNARGCWTSRYRPFTCFDAHGAILSSVCIYSLDFVVLGQPLRVAQVSGVGTDPAHRRKGWNRELTERALAWAAGDHEWVFLFSDEDAIPYYRRQGFEPVEEHSPVLAVEGGGSGSLGRPLDLDVPADWDFLRRRAEERAPVSEVCGVLAPELFLCHALNSSARTFHHADLDVVLFAEQRGGRLVIHDLLAREMPGHADLVRAVAGPDVREVAFSFVPDRLGLGAEDVAWEPLPDSDLHVLGPNPLEGCRFLVPRTAHA